MAYPYFCGYDDKGNLYADGFQTTSGAIATFAELPKGKRTFKDIKLDKGIDYPGNVRWDGKYVAVGDQEYGYTSSGLYESAIFQTTGEGGKVVHVIPLRGTGDIIGFSIEGKTLIGPNAQWKNAGDVFFWNYPAVGKPARRSRASTRRLARRSASRSSYPSLTRRFGLLPTLAVFAIENMRRRLANIGAEPASHYRSRESRCQIGPPTASTPHAFPASKNRI